MKAFTYDRYGPPETLRAADLPDPVPGRGEVTIDVRAVSINGSDVEILTGRPAYSRVFGLFRPRVHVLGSDIAGMVAAIGPDVTDIAPGDRVIVDNFGRFGGFGEVALAEAARVLPMPEGLTFEEASVLPQSAVIALAGIVDAGASKGARVLVNGAAGGAGCIAVQMAKSLGATVTAVDRGARTDGLAALGADRVIDAGAEDFADGTTRYDLILDLFGTRSAGRVARALAPGGRYLLVGGAMRALLSTAIRGALPFPGGRRTKVLAVKQEPERLSRALDLLAQGAFRPVVDRVFPFERTPEALAWHIQGRRTGKVVISGGVSS